MTFLSWLFPFVRPHYQTNEVSRFAKISSLSFGVKGSPSSTFLSSQPSSTLETAIAILQWNLPSLFNYFYHILFIFYTLTFSFKIFKNMYQNKIYLHAKVQLVKLLNSNLTEVLFHSNFMSHIRNFDSY